MKIGLLTAAIGGDNAGDALIEEAIRRIVVADEFYRFPLIAPITKKGMDALNRLDCAIVCGTNLYQRVFACNLNSATINAIKIPIIPMGIGSSSEIGRLPQMKWLHARAVRLLHERCKISSVRDPASLEFLRGIGVTNSELTGCPVLFHALRAPRFDGSGTGLSVSVRARILDPRAQALFEKEEEILDAICKACSPTLVLQSPYDLPVGEALSRKFALKLCYDPKWQSGGYAELVREHRATLGFRLHFGMLSLAYGKPAYFVAHDSRTASFCHLLGIGYHDIRYVCASDLIAQAGLLLFDGDRVAKRWNELAEAMVCFLEENGLRSAIALSPSVASGSKS
jgi:polysaccharide pyruvyl transferase WcaK-like protein